MTALSFTDEGRREAGGAIRRVVSGLNKNCSAVTSAAQHDAATASDITNRAITDYAVQVETVTAAGARCREYGARAVTQETVSAADLSESMLTNAGVVPEALTAGDVVSATMTGNPTTALGRNTFAVVPQAGRNRSKSTQVGMSGADGADKYRFS